MTDEGNANNVRNAMVGIVAVVLLGLGGCLTTKDGADGPDPSDVIEIVVEQKALTIPEELRTMFGDLDTVTIGLVNSKGQFRAFSVDGGVPRDLCPASEGIRHGSRTCKRELASQDLMVWLSNTGATCGACRDSQGNLRACKKSSNRRPCSTAQFICRSSCQ